MTEEFRVVEVHQQQEAANVLQQGLREPVADSHTLW
jgi:hypothetical protein